MRILTSEQMRRVEQRCAGVGISSSTLMENAGRAVAEEIRRAVGTGFRRVVILVGPGNNGGDGEVAARYLRGWGFDVILYLIGSRPSDDKNLLLAREAGASVVEYSDDSRARLANDISSANLIVDAVFGTGWSKRGHGRPLSGTVSFALDEVRLAKQSRPWLMVFAVDLPSGLDADSGAVDEACLYADETLVLGYPKVGLFNLPGAERVGKMTILDIGIPARLEVTSNLELASARLVAGLLPSRPLVSNKGTFGKVMVVAGSARYAGAAYLACGGVMRVGAGLVTLAAPANVRSIVASRLVEATYLPLEEPSPIVMPSQAAQMVRRSLEGFSVLLIGCGLGQGDEATAMVRDVLLNGDRLSVPCVIDADALNILSAVSRPTESWRGLTADAILTPHPGEMARLTGMTVDEIQQDRIGVAARMAERWQQTVVLKGAYTVTASPEGRVVVSPFGTAALASAGTGDVLAGAIAGLLAQGMRPFEAAVTGVYLHGKAGEIAGLDMGDAGVIASDILIRLPASIKSVKTAGRQGD